MSALAIVGIIAGSIAAYCFGAGVTAGLKARKYSDPKLWTFDDVNDALPAMVWPITLVWAVLGFPARYAFKRLAQPKLPPARSL